MTPEIEQLIHDVLHGEASDPQRQRLSDWVASSDANARAYLRVAMDERAIRASMERASARSLETLDVSADDSGAGRVLAELARCEAQAHAPLVELIDLRTTWWQDHARVLLAGAGVAAAAMIALAVLLWGGQATDEHTTPTASDWQTPDTAQDKAFDESVARGDATLTAERGAVWQGIAGETLPQVGDVLKAGRRLILAEGVAEITTRRGAIAIIEAPCSVQIVGDNALYMQRGKLLGICETESAKGFLVRTPHMDVTDLGTRFGVDATHPHATWAHVLEGMVQVAGASREGPGQRLHEGKAVVAREGERDLLAVPIERERFASITPRRIDLLGTGRSLTDGESDPNWRVITVDGRRLIKPAFLRVGAPPNAGTSGIPVNDPATSQWLRGDHIAASRNSKEITFTCRTRFELPNEVDPDTARLVLRFDADERIDEVRINGRAITPPPHSFTDDHVELNTLLIPGPFAAGLNTLELDVIDLVRNSGLTWGLRAEIDLETINRPAP